MKSIKAAFACVSLAVLFPFVLKGASVAQVVSKDPEGAMYTRVQTMPVNVGMDLMEGDILETFNSTLILSLCEGSLLTVYPNSVLHLSRLGYGSASLRLIRGEVLGDSSSGCTFTVETKVGAASISNGVYGVVHHVVGDDWTLQVRNLDGNVSFVGDLKLDSSNVRASVIEPGKVIQIPAGEEIIVRGVYNEASGVFLLSPEGAIFAALDDQSRGELRGGAQYMSSVYRSFRDGTGPEDEDGDDPEAVIIDIPFVDFETASDKG